MAIRFAPIIRVSTESQEAQGESLRTQRTQIINYVKTLGGIIPEHCWQYTGQEHATPGQERNKLEKLLTDASKNVFDAVIVCEPSRWSRDNVRNEQGLEILLQNKIRFFSGTTEYDLHDPQARMFLALSAVISQFQARMQSKKSIENRIHRAKRGIPTCGKLPYGRTFDRKTNTWGINPEKHKKIIWAADQYISGEKGILEIAQVLGMNAQALWKTMRQRCGDKWEMSFCFSDFNIDETVQITIPRLLSEETIAAIHKKMEANKTYTHGHIKNKYLLGRMIFCEHCGLALVGDRHPGRKFRIYKHQKHQDISRPCPRNTRWTIRADEIEDIVVSELFKMFGDVKSIEKAAKSAIPDLERIQDLRKQKKDFEKDLADIARSKGRIVQAIADGVMENADAKLKMEELKERGRLLEEQIHKIDAQIENVPTEEEINNEAKFLQKMLTAKAKHPRRLALMSWDDKRALCETVFAGKDIHGNRLGVYIRKEGKAIHYTIRGILNTNIAGTISLEKPKNSIDKDNSIAKCVSY